MSHHIKLENMKVGDIQHLLVKEASVIGLKQSIKDLLARTVDDPRTRHIYVM
jgi:hypothetical protein